MAVNPMQRKARNSFLLGMLLTLIIASLPIGFLFYQMSGLQETLAKKEAKIGCMLNQDVQSGAELSASMITEVKLESIPADALTKGDIGGIKTKTALKKGVVLSADMVISVDENVRKDTRIQEYNMVTLPSKLQKGEYIDIRLTLPSGQDFVVVSKKQVIDCSSTTIWIQVTEDEIMMMNNAIIEYYIMKGSNLYATIYNEAGLQDASTPTYAMSALVQSTFAQNPNILNEAKIAFNQRTETMETNRKAIEMQMSAYNADKRDNVEEGVENTRAKQQEDRLKYIGDLDASY